MKILKPMTAFLKRNSSTILTCVGAIGVVATVVLTTKATLKAIDILDKSEERKGDDLATVEKAKITVKVYTPVFIVGAATLACMFGANALNKRQQASLAAACALASGSYQKYTKKVKELYGEEAHQKVLDSIAIEQAKDISIYAGGLISYSTLDFDENDSEDARLFYDAYSKRYFESTISRVLQAEYHLNRNYVLGWAVLLNQFYEFLGLEPINGGDAIGWTVNDDEIHWIDFDHHKTVLEDGLEYFIVEMVIPPFPLDGV